MLYPHVRGGHHVTSIPNDVDEIRAITKGLGKGPVLPVEIRKIWVVMRFDDGAIRASENAFRLRSRNRMRMRERQVAERQI
jgi:hypothetical protein